MQELIIRNSKGQRINWRCPFIIINLSYRNTKLSPEIFSDKCRCIGEKLAKNTKTA